MKCSVSIQKCVIILSLKVSVRIKLFFVFEVNFTHTHTHTHTHTQKDATKKLLELINEFSNVAGYKINMQKSVAFLYTNNEVAEREIKKIIPFTIEPKIIRYLRINLTKEVNICTLKTTEHW